MCITNSTPDSAICLNLSLRYQMYQVFISLFYHQLPVCLKYSIDIFCISREQAPRKGLLRLYLVTLADRLLASADHVDQPVVSTQGGLTGCGRRKAWGVRPTVTGHLVEYKGLDFQTFASNPINFLLLLLRFF